ncbi:zinc ribbon domain-containing protein [Actinomadura kijaniata]|uniref:zinc ribbon domain-containing protein n=1 Tax=Actinomadura kijaniata TaxID=46161 RepID=UPI003F1B3F22
MLFDRVQQVLADHKTTGEKQREHRHYLKSTVYCGRCGSRLCLTKARGKYLYFFYLGRHQKRTSCTMKYLTAEAVEAVVECYYATIQLTPDLQEQVRAGLHAELDRQRTQAEPEITYAHRRVTELELEQERRRLARATVEGIIPGDLAREEHERIETELRGARAVLATAEVIAERIDEMLQSALALIGRCDEVCRLGGPGCGASPTRHSLRSCSSPTRRATAAPWWPEPPSRSPELASELSISRVPHTVTQRTSTKLVLVEVRK